MGESFLDTRVEVFCVLFQISLVDLAGSERANKTGATAEQLKVTWIYLAYLLETRQVDGS